MSKLWTVFVLIWSCIRYPYLSSEGENLISIPTGCVTEPVCFLCLLKPHTSAGERTDLSSYAPTLETMAERQGDPPSESADHKPEPKQVAGENGTSQSNAEKGGEIITGKSVGNRKA